MTLFTPVWIDGFEHGAMAAAAGAYSNVTASPAIVTSPVRSGLRAGQISSSAAAESFGLDLPSGTRTAVMSCYVRMTSLAPGANHQILIFTNANGSAQIWFDDSANRFFAAINNVDQQVFGPNPIVIDTWYRIDCMAVASGGTTSITARAFNDTGPLTATNSGVEVVSSRAQTDADFTRASCGTAGATTSTQYYDDWVVSLTAADYPFVPHYVVSLIPNEDGTHNITTPGDMDSFTTTAFDNSTTNGNTFIGHRPMQRANTPEQVVRQDLQSASTYMEFLFENMPAPEVGAIAGVRTYATHVMSSTTGTPTAEMRLMDAASTEILTTGMGSTSVSMIQTLEDPGTTVTVRKRMADRPANGWTYDLVNGLKIQAGFNNIAADVNFIDAMLEVLVVPASMVPQPSVLKPMAHMLRR